MAYGVYIILNSTSLSLSSVLKSASNALSESGVNVLPPFFMDFFSSLRNFLRAFLISFSNPFSDLALMFMGLLKKVRSGHASLK